MRTALMFDGGLRFTADTPLEKAYFEWLSRQKLHVAMGASDITENYGEHDEMIIYGVKDLPPITQQAAKRHAKARRK